MDKKEIYVMSPITMTNGQVEPLAVQQHTEAVWQRAGEIQAVSGHINLEIDRPQLVKVFQEGKWRHSLMSAIGIPPVYARLMPE